MKRLRKTNFIQFTNWNDRRGNWYCMSMFIERYKTSRNHGAVRWWLFK